MFLFNKFYTKKENNNIRKLNLKIDIPDNKSLTLQKKENKIVNLSSFFNKKKKLPKSGWMFDCIKCRSITSKSIIVDDLYEIHLCNSCHKKNNYYKECNEVIREYSNYI